MSATVAPRCDHALGPLPPSPVPNRRAEERERAAARAAAELQRAISAMSRGADGTRRWTADLLAAIRSVLMQAHLRTAASHVQG